MPIPTPHLWLPYTQMLGAPEPPRAVRASGCHIELEDGRRLIDAVSSWWTVCHGHNHPHIAAAIKAQLHEMPHVMFGGLVHHPAEHLAQRLAALLPGTLNHTFLSDSGSVAIEVAMKMAVQFWINQGEPDRKLFVSMRGGYHGDTLGAMSVTDPEEGMHALFRGYMPQQLVADLPVDENRRGALQRLLESHRDRIAAVIIEPLVQCAGGMRMYSPEVLASVSEAVRASGLLLILDEIATGFGRTGTLFAMEQADLVPDIVCLGKALTGGMIGLAATVASEDVFAAFLSSDPDAALMHGPTYMANPLACAAANASLDLFETRPRLDQVADIERHLRNRLPALQDVPGVVDVRVLGAIGAIEVETLHDIDLLKAAFVEAGLWLRPFGNVIYTMPPFISSRQDLDRITSAISEILPLWADRRLT